MTSRDFAYWLMGFFEIAGVKELTLEQSQMIARHLALVFQHDIDPQAGGPDVQAVLNAIHTGAPIPVSPASSKPPAKLAPLRPPAQSDIKRC